MIFSNSVDSLLLFLVVMFVMNVQATVTLTLVLSSFGKCANILGFFPVPSISHQVVFQSIWKELALRGHNVTVYTPNPLEEPGLPNLTEVSLNQLYDVINRQEAQSVMYEERSPFEKFYYIYENLVLEYGEMALRDSKVQQLLKDNYSKFDLVLVEPYPTTFLALGNKFKCPTIATIPFGGFSPQYEFMGNSIHPLLYPDIVMNSLEDLSLIERVYNVFETLKMLIYYRLSVLPRIQKDIQKHFGDDCPPIQDIQKNISALFVTTNPVLSIPRPLVPNTVQMGYMHLKPRKGLPEDIKRLLDDADEGVVYMSLGSNVKSAYLPKRTRGIFKDVFSELPYQVLWKWENDSVPQVSSNVYFSKWFPQQDILGHPNVKVFITQAGFQSSEEAIFHKVPTVAIPFFADQTYNAKRMDQLGMGKYLNPWKLNKEELKATILEVVQNPKYREKVADLSRISQDQPMTGLERAIWWIEYVIRNKGAKHLRSPYVDTPLYQSYLLDIIGFSVVLIYLLYLPFKYLGKYQKSVYVCFISFILYCFVSW